MHYIGKDVVHQGAALELDPTQLETSLAHSARKNVRKAQRAGFVIERRRGTPTELRDLRALWYFPEDPNFPVILGPREILYLAFLDGQLAGGMILVPVGNHLFLNNLLADDRGKEHQLQSLLLWNAVHDLADSGFDYLDIGASYRPNLQRFFQKWAGFRYPVIFNPPALLPRITLRPFQRLVEVPDEVDEATLSSFCHGRPYTICPDRDAARAVLTQHGQPFEEVSLPTPAGAGLELVDLTEVLPLAHGALILGAEISPAVLWSEHGCYDFVKTDYLRRALTTLCAEWPEVQARRMDRWIHLAEHFRREDVGILPAGPFPPTLAMEVPDAETLAAHYRMFGVEARADAGVLHLPCHQDLNDAELEYLYAIYRGNLNLCSAWVPTRVRGRLKLETA